MENTFTWEDLRKIPKDEQYYDEVFLTNKQSVDLGLAMKKPLILTSYTKKTYFLKPNYSYYRNNSWASHSDDVNIDDYYHIDWL